MSSDVNRAEIARGPCYTFRSFKTVCEGTKISVSRTYELMWLLGSDADEEAGSASVEKMNRLITDGGGEVVRSAPWGRRTLAYPINESKEGSYFLAYFTLDSDAVPGFERTLATDQTIIRHLLTQHERPFPKASEMGSPDEDPPPRGRRRGPR